MTAAQRSFFANAAARVTSIVTTDVIDAQANDTLDISVACSLPEPTILHGIIDDVIIFAALDSLDGPGGVLAASGPCLTRNIAGAGQPEVVIPAGGTMIFDTADVATLTGLGSFQEVVTHEMLHVLGFGTLWTDRQLLQDSGTANPRYTGSQGRQRCVSVGGGNVCSVSVPVEATGGAGTANSHWRESTFDKELMTGFIDQSPNPLSVITIGSLADLGYNVNFGAADPYTVPSSAALRANNAVAANQNTILNQTGWERSLGTDHFYVLENGHARKVMRR